jgi:hypothetical protein
MSNRHGCQTGCEVHADLLFVLCVLPFLGQNAAFKFAHIWTLAYRIWTNCIIICANLVNFSKEVKMLLKILKYE